jgi:hypothetical protein
LNASHISFSTLVWLLRWYVNGKFLIKSVVVNDL